MESLSCFFLQVKNTSSSSSLRSRAASSPLQSRRCSCSLPSHSALKRYKEVCLVDSLRAHRYKVPYTKDGPFWAVADGNALLQPWQTLLLSFDNNFWFCCERSHVGGIRAAVSSNDSKVAVLCANAERQWGVQSSGPKVSTQPKMASTFWPTRNISLPSGCSMALPKSILHTGRTSGNHAASQPLQRSRCNVSATRACGLSTQPCLMEFSKYVRPFNLQPLLTLIWVEARATSSARQPSWICRNSRLVMCRCVFLALNVFASSLKACSAFVQVCGLYCLAHSPL